MKRGIIGLLVLMLLLCGAWISAPRASAAETHSHCVCGGTANGIADHVCDENVTWESWDGTTELVNGHSYYLIDTDGDGVIMLSKTLIIEKKHISLCLNGVELTCESRTVNVNGVKSGSNFLSASLNICDCKGTGSITSTSTDAAPVLHSYTNNRGQATVKLYSGHLIAKDNDKTTEKEAGVVRLGNNTGDIGATSHHKAAFFMYGGSIFGGRTQKTGGNVYISTDCEFHMYGGTVTDGHAGGNGGIFFTAGLLNLQGGTVTGGSGNLGDGIYVHTKGSLTVGGTVRVEGNHGSNVYLPSGKTLNAENITEGYVGVTSVDAIFAKADHANSANHFFYDETGYEVAYGGGMLCRIAPAQITKLSIAPNVVAMGYKAMFQIPENLHSEVKYGYELWLDGYPVHTFAGQKSLTDSLELTLRVKNIMKTSNDLLTNLANSQMAINARTFICLADGTRLESQVETYDLRQMLEQADAYYETFNTTQTDALQSMYTAYKDIMLGWDLPNVIHSSGTWIDLDQSSFSENIQKSGQFRLVEDVDIGESTLFINANKTVTLCLNGHTISGSACLFRIYGTFNICDCHAGAQEGTLTSALTGENASYAPLAYIHPGTMNIYGGNLTATGKVPNGGVLIAGCGTINGVSGVPGKINMFGGRIYGGQTYKDGGLVTLYDNAEFTMYDGELYGGKADRNGGAVCINGGKSAYLYGGRIYDCTAGSNGGGIYTTSGKAVLYLGDNLTLENNTAALGGHVYHASNEDLTVAGAAVTGGKANTAGGIYGDFADISLSGDAVIRDNTNGNLYLNAANGLDKSKLTAGADVHIYNTSAMPFCIEPRYITLEREDYSIATVAGQQVLLPEDFTVPADVDGFQVGFGRSDISPTETGLPLAGYGNTTTRLSEDMGNHDYDRLTVSTVAITDENGETVLLLSVDLIRSTADFMKMILPAVSAATGVPEGNIFTTFTHTHSAPDTKETGTSTIWRYNTMLPERFAQSANQAMADRAPATMQTGSFEVEGLNFTRHYKYKDISGNWYYFGDNFGTAPASTDFIGQYSLQHVTEADRTMHMVKFTRDGKDILMANWRVHPHMTGSGSETKVSADIIGTTRYYFEIDQDCHFVYLQGAAGNINETSKITEEQHGYDYTQYGQNLAQQIKSAVAHNVLAETEIGLWQVDNCKYDAIADVPSEDEYNHAKAASATYNTWLKENPEASSRDKRSKLEELGYQSIYHINNVINRYSYKDTQLPLNVFALGKSLAFYTAPGELWDTVSMEMEDAFSGKFGMILCMGYSQEHYNYFVYDPDNNGQMIYESYESNNYRFVAPNTINGMIACWKEALNTMYNDLESDQ